MLSPELWNFESEIGCINHFLSYSVNFVPEHESIFLAFLTYRIPKLRGEFFQTDRTDSLLDTDDSIALVRKTPYCIKCFLRMIPGDTLLSPDGRFTNLCGRRQGANTAKPHFVNLE